MIDNKFLFTILGIFVVIFAICNGNLMTVSQEGFGFGTMPSGGIRKHTEVMALSGVEKGNMFSVANYESNLSPRFSNVDYGAQLRYNLPSYKNLAAPLDPLASACAVKEDYTEGFCSSGGCGTASAAPRNPAKSSGSCAGAAAGDYNDVLDKAYAGSSYPEASSTLPLGTMSTLGPAGETQNFLTFDRFMVANRNSRTRGLGDWFRGDLPIVPCKKGNFDVSVTPNLDLNGGAMNVMGGFNNETSNSLSALMSTASGGTDTTLGGVNVANQLSTMLGANFTDVSVDAFP